MRVGSKHTYKLPSSSGTSYDSATCEVKGEDNIRVAAGSFDTVRIECGGFWNRIVGDIRSGPMSTISWYAPSIGLVVKSQYFSFNGIGTPTGSLPYTKNQTELVEFVAGK